MPGWRGIGEVLSKRNNHRGHPSTSLRAGSGTKRQNPKHSSVERYVLCGLLLFRRLRRRLRHSLVNRRMRTACIQNRDLIDLHRIVWPVIPITRHASNFLDEVHASLIALAKDRISAIQARIGNFGDEKL